ncbi:uncharacterized protein LOC127278234 [Leptopilina boulardi]|uniref:uncharacterized protein LOC127278234 n=1 Tax=Leptopilina boulardi TaxID=63433 RepID=UPI0021F68278|nr:uncharacterized protein LOC127278234 [Leptopilina boulardi]
MYLSETLVAEWQEKIFNAATAGDNEDVIEAEAGFSGNAAEVPRSCMNEYNFPETRTRDSNNAKEISKSYVNEHYNDRVDVAKPGPSGNAAKMSRSHSQKKKGDYSNL